MNTLTLQTRQSLREKLSWKIAYTLKPIYFFLRRHRKAWNITIEDMQQMPACSLGNDVAAFLTKHHLEMMPKAEWHDVYHVLFEYETNIRDEACIQFVPVGNGRWSLPYLSCILVTAVIWPEYWGDFYAAYKRGRAAAKFHEWDFEPLLRLPTQQVRNMIFGPKNYEQEMRDAELFI